jgi:2'-5' RNA ligase
LRPVSYLHVSLHGLGSVDISERWLQIAGQQLAVATRQIPPFEVCFDRVLSYANKQSEHPVVLADGNNGNAELMTLHRELRAVLGMGKSSFSPHITLLCDTKVVAAESIEPIRWTVDEVVLIRSEAGEYERLGHWSLGT